MASVYDLLQDGQSVQVGPFQALARVFYDASANVMILEDPNGNEVGRFARVASAVNEVTATAAAAGVAPSVKATGDDTNVSLELGVKGTTSVVEVTAPLVQLATKTATAGAATLTLTIAQLLTKVIDATPTEAQTMTLPTAANLVAGITNAKVGDSFWLYVNNISASTITVVAGSGGTGDGTLTVAADVIRAFLVIITNVTGGSEAYFLYGT